MNNVFEVSAAACRAMSAFAHRGLDADERISAALLVLPIGATRVDSLNTI